MKHFLFFSIILLLVNACNTKKTDAPIVILTFDDAEISHYTNVAAALKQHHFDATFFVCEFPLKHTNEKLQYMTWTQIKELNDMGFEIGNHTGHHKNVTKLSHDALVKEVQFVENKCKEYNIPAPISFAYPGNRYDSASVATLYELGYKYARAGGSRLFNSKDDNILAIPSYTTSSSPKLVKRVTVALDSLKAGEILVLTFHGIPDLIHTDYSTSMEFFEEILQFIDDQNYQVLAMRDLQKHLD